MVAATILAFMALTGWLSDRASAPPSALVTSLRRRDPLVIARRPTVVPSALVEYAYPRVGRVIQVVLCCCIAPLPLVGTTLMLVPMEDELWQVRWTIGPVFACLGASLLVWILRMPRYRVWIEPGGIHAVTAFGRTAIRWQDTTAIEATEIRGGPAVSGQVLTRFVRVHSPQRSIRIESRLLGFDDLARSVYDATGLEWV